MQGTEAHGVAPGPIALALAAAGERGGIHGHHHWRRVGETGIDLAHEEGVSRHVALLFAIYMIKPSPFCVLDELDAALDESNIGRFVDVLQGFLAQSQFLVVTHNQRTITAASVLYGVTMAKNSGISKLVSVRFRERDSEGVVLTPDGAGAPPVAAETVAAEAPAVEIASLEPAPVDVPADAALADAPGPVAEPASASTETPSA